MTLPERLSHGTQRSLFAEIAIIVVGVVLALGAGELVDGWNWQRKVAAGEIKLKREAKSNFEYAAEQVAIAPCLQQQLEVLRTRLLASGEVLEPAPVYSDALFRFVYRMPSRPYSTSAWVALNSDGTATHQDDFRLQLYSELYTQIADLGARRRLGSVLEARSMILSTPIALDPSARATLMGDLMEQSGHARLQSLVAVQVMASLRDLGQAPPAAGVDEFLIKESGTVAFCSAHHLPLADWRKVLGQQEVTTQK
jgi:hypothetical protein